MTFFRTRVTKTVLMWCVLAVAPVAMAQIQPVAGLAMTANGMLGVGYAGGSGAGSTGGTDSNSNSLYLLTSGGVSGYYYNPKFLRFDVTPNFRWDRSSGSSSDALREGDEGLGASVMFLEGSSHPVNLQYNLDRITTTTLSGGEAPVSAAANGLSQNINLSTGFRPNHLPTLSLYMGKGGGSNSTIGLSSAGSSSDHFSYGASSNYNILGFGLSAGYTDSNSQMHTPDLLSLGLPTNSSSHEKTEYTNLVRKLPLKSNLNISYSHADTDTELQGTENKLSFDTAVAYLSSIPTQRLSLSATGSYLSNAGAQLFTQAVSGQTLNTNDGLLNSGRNLSFGGSASYYLGGGIGSSASVSHSDSTSGGSDAKFDSFGAGISYYRGLFRGKFQGSYQPQYYVISQTSSATTVSSSGLAHSGSANYVRRYGRWVGSGNFNLTISQGWSSATTAALSRSMSGGIRLSTRIAHEWNFSGGANLTQMSLGGMTGNFSSSVFTSIANRTWTFSMQDQMGRGYLVSTPFGLQSVNATAVPVLNTYYSTSDGISGSVAYMRRRLQMSGTVSKATSNVETQLTPVQNGNLNFDAHVTYKFRRVDVQVGYRRWSQDTTANAALNEHLQTYWIQLLRPFHMF